MNYRQSNREQILSSKHMLNQMVIYVVFEKENPKENEQNSYKILYHSLALYVLKHI